VVSMPTCSPVSDMTAARGVVACVSVGRDATRWAWRCSVRAGWAPAGGPGLLDLNLNFSFPFWNM
jgi:hypothetical protein